MVMISRSLFLSVLVAIHAFPHLVFSIPTGPSASRVSISTPNTPSVPNTPDVHNTSVVDPIPVKNGTESDSPVPLSPGFDIDLVIKRSIELPSHSWEYGTQVEALLELYHPHLSAFGKKPFPMPTSVNASSVQALEYAKTKAITLEGKAGHNKLVDGDGAAGDPVNLVYGAMLLGKSEKKYADAVDALLTKVPRHPNSAAISHRANIIELWADSVSMTPPSLAAYGADQGKPEIILKAVNQIRKYCEVLQVKESSGQGLVKHIIGPQSPDLGLWGNGNAWFARGAAQVLATLLKSPVAQKQSWLKGGTADLVKINKNILDAIHRSEMDDDLVPNYIDLVGQKRGFGEISGSSLLAATSYRMTTLFPVQFGKEYAEWADKIRKTLGGKDKDGKPHIDAQGNITLAVNPLNWFDEKPFTTGSPEGNLFVVLLYTAWRDCVLAKKCSN